MGSTNIGERLQPSMSAKTEWDNLCQKANVNNSAIKKDEKDQIKTRALEAGVVEPVHLLALQNALMIAKIMRYEYPQDWFASDIGCCIDFLANPCQARCYSFHYRRPSLLHAVRRKRTAFTTDPPHPLASN